MYHGQVMIEQERIPQLIQTAQLLEIRGLCEVGEGDSSTANERNTNTDKEEYVKTGSNSFLAGLLNAGVSATKRSSSVISDAATSLSNSSPIPSPVAKRQRNSAGPPRPVPMLQSILSQQVTTPKTPIFDLTKVMGSSTKALSALVSKASNTSSSSVFSISCSNKSFPTSLNHLLGGLCSVVASSSAGASNGGENSTTNSSFEDVNDKDERPESSYCDMENNSGQGIELVHDTLVEIKEEPLMEFEEFGEDHSSNRGGRGTRTDDEEDDDSESETELRGMSDSSRGEAFSLPLLAQHLAAPNLLSASAKLRAAASQARTISSANNPSISQVVLSPSTPPDMGMI